MNADYIKNSWKGLNSRSAYQIKEFQSKKQIYVMERGLMAAVDNYPITGDYSFPVKKSLECIELAYLYSVRGAFTMSLDNGSSRSLELTPGILIFLPVGKETIEVNTIFELEHSCPVKMVTIFITPEKLSSLMGVPVHLMPDCLSDDLSRSEGLNWEELSHEMSPAVESTVFQILQCSMKEPAKKLFIEGKVLELLSLEIERRLNKKSPPPVLSQEDVESLHRIKRIMIESILDPPTLAELARKVGLNEKKIKRGFRILFGTTVYGFLQNHRMETARSLMMSKGMGVSEAAWAVGYVNVSHFSAAFRKHVGVLPGDYLREIRWR